MANQQQQASASGSHHQDTRIGPYAISREIGKGSFAVVHKGYAMRAPSDLSGSLGHTVPTRVPVAIKIVTRKKLTPKLLDNLEGEIAILKAISHPNIVELRDCLKTDSYIYLVMQFCSSGDLSLYIKKRGQLLPTRDDPLYTSQDSFVSEMPSTATTSYPHPEDGGLNEAVVRSFLAQLAGALEFMRGKNIVHRDIKPQNLLLQPPDAKWIAAGHSPEILQMKVADFGFARNLPAASLAETLCGSPLYMAPEILRYEKYDAKADLWSVGAVLFEMCVGKPPFRAANHVELLRKIERGEDRIKFPDERSAGSLQREAERRAKDGEPPLPHPHTVSDDLKTLVRSLLRRNPIERSSFADFFASRVIVEVAERAAAKASARVPSSRSGRDQAAALAQEVKSTDNTAAQDSAVGRSRPVQIPRPFKSRYVVGASAAPVEKVTTEHTSAVDTMTSTPSSSLQHLAAATATTGPSRSPGSAESFGRVPSRSQSTEPAGDDSFLGREYVMIEKRNVEVNALADELAASPQTQQSALRGGPSPLSLARRPSRLARFGSSLGAVTGAAFAPSLTSPSQATAPSATSASPPLAVRAGTTPPSSTWAATVGIGVNAPFALPPGSRPSSFPRRSSLSSSGSPSPRLVAQHGLISTPATPPASVSQGGAHPSLIAGPISPPLSEDSPVVESVGGVRAQVQTSPGAGPNSAPSSALARAISMASLRLFGVPSGMSLRGAAALVRNRSAARRTALIRAGDAPDSVEASLLVTLEDLCQKSFVLSECADAKLAQFFPVGPHQAAGPQEMDASEGSTMGRSVGTTGGAVSGSSYAPPSRAARRTSSTSSVVSAAEAMQAEVAAGEALVLYVRALSFLQRGIAATRTFLESRTRGNVSAYTSAEVNESVQWVRARFNLCYEKADFARSKCGEIPESAQSVDKLIFDKALSIARAAALDELENHTVMPSSESQGRSGASATSPASLTTGWDPNGCLLAYETASTMLLCLLDPGEEGMALSEGSMGTVKLFIESIDKRLNALQRKLDGSA